MVRTAEPTPIFVCSTARTHAVQLQAGAALGDLRAAVKRIGHIAGEDGLCVVGGAPLPLDDRLTLAQCGIRANSSVQVAGRLRGGVEVTIRGRQHTVDARGHLDLSDQDLGPAEVKEVATFLATPAGVALNSVALDECELTGTKIKYKGASFEQIGELDVDLSGFTELCSSLKSSTIVSLSLRKCYLGSQAVVLLADAIKLMRAIARLVLTGNMITSSSQDWRRIDPALSAQVLSAASDISRRRLRTAQVLAFSFALHDRLGATTAVCELDLDKGAVDLVRIVSSIVHFRQGHEALCSALARRHPWYEVAAQALISEGVPHR